jgi:TolB-like protein/AraC-like DNA-binding protein/Tfp pilus assembly protein PilF
MTESPTMDQIFIRKLTAIVLANLENEQFGVDEVSRQMGMTYSKIKQKIKSINNQSLSQFIREIRLKRAMEMLQLGEATVSEIAIRVGFGSSTYFIKCFHDYYGFPPGEVKKREISESGHEENILNQGAAKQEQKKPIRQVIVSLLPWALLVCTFIIIAVLLVFYIQGRRQSEALAKLEKSVAVLPFINDSPNDSTTYFINGIMEEVLTNLQKIKDFRVLSRNSVEQFRNNTSRSTPEIAKKLGVNYIVEGAGQKYGNTFRLRVQLIKAAKEGHLWAESYEKEIKETKDIFNIQSRIAQAIASELKAIIAPEEKQLIEKSATESLTAYDFYLRGKEEQNKYMESIPSTRISLDRANELFKKALEYDTSFARAYVGMAQVYWSKHYWETYLSGNFLDSVLFLANKALSIDDKSAEAYTTRGRYYDQKDLTEKAVEEYDKALKINPNSWEVYYEKGELYAYDDFVKAIDNYQKAASLNRGSELPSILTDISFAFQHAGFKDQCDYYATEALMLDGDSSQYYFILANHELCWGNFEKSLASALKANELNSDNIHNLGENIAFNYILLGKNDESLKYYKQYFEKSIAQGVLSVSYMHRIGYAYWKNGYRKEAEYYFSKQIEYCNNAIKLGRKNRNQLFSYYDLACVYAFRGEKDKAYENLRKLNQIKVAPLWLVTYIKHDPLFNSIKDEPEFQQIVIDVEAKYNKEHERVRKWLEDQGTLEKRP